MKLGKLAIAAAIIPTLGFSCHNEPNYAREGMSNPPTGSGAGVVPVPVGTTAAGAAAAPAAPATPATPAAAPATPAARPDSTKGAATKKP